MAETLRTVNVEVETRSIRPDDPFFDDKNLQIAENTSLEFWRSLSDDEHKAMIVLLRDTLTHLHADPESWMPGSLIPTPNGGVQIVITVQLGQIHQEVVLMRQRAEQHMVEMRDDLIVMRGELDKPR